MAERLNKFEKEIEAVSPEEAEGLEGVLRKMRYCLHENHYLITGGRIYLSWQHLLLDHLVMFLSTCPQTTSPIFLLFSCSPVYLPSISCSLFI